MKATIEQWRVFRALVEQGSYARAAETLDKSVSSVHVAVRRLQAALGVPLFEVVGRRVAPTDVGLQLMHRAGALLEQARTLERLASTLAEGGEASVRLAVETIFSRAELRAALASVARTFPHVRVVLHETVIHGAADLLEQGQVDIAITPLLPKVGSYAAIGRVRFTPVAHPDHRLHRLGRPLTLDDLRSARHIMVRDSAPHLGRHESWLQAQDTWTVSSMDLSIELISAGLGFAWLPLSRIDRALAEGSLAPLPMAKLNDRHVELFLAHLDGDVTGPVCTHLLGLLGREAAGTWPDERVERDARRGADGGPRGTMSR